MPVHKQGEVHAQRRGEVVGDGPLVDAQRPGPAVAVVREHGRAELRRQGRGAHEGLVAEHLGVERAEALFVRGLQDERERSDERREEQSAGDDDEELPDRLEGRARHDVAKARRGDGGDDHVHRAQITICDGHASNVVLRVLDGLVALRRQLVERGPRDLRVSLDVPVQHEPDAREPVVAEQVGHADVEELFLRPRDAHAVAQRGV
mmetsp:Transcript_20107/g.69277  ORF Transcript_20107/g.69277 Transcript_20107/m.69277 type:complete len:206 (-) Transcript_20107:1472-2089(-)